VCWCNVGFSKTSPDKHVDVCVDSDEDRGSTPLASTSKSFRGCHASEQHVGGLCFARFLPASKTTAWQASFFWLRLAM